MKKIYYYSGGFFIFLSVVFLYFYTREYPAYEVDADNFRDLAKVNDVDYYFEYASILSPYYGFENMRVVHEGLKENVSRQNSSFAEYDYTPAGKQEHYGVEIKDCTRLSVRLENGTINKIQQFEQGSKFCKPKPKVLEERVAFLKNKGFTFKESKFKNSNHSILIKDLNKDFFHIIEVVYDSYGESVIALEFGLFSKARYPSLNLISVGI